MLGDGKITPNEWIRMCPCFDAKDEIKGFDRDLISILRYSGWGAMIYVI